ncbi:hypothetical protein [Gordonia terrae]|uniref:hypothetical protein n=1 Tax=Gordonia terrae TaxID=2055 RepID=UPI003F6D375C
MALDVGRHDDIDWDLVTLHWNDGPPVGDAHELIERARRVDAEMSFTSVGAQRQQHGSSCTAEVFTRLRRWAAPRTDGVSLAAVLTFTQNPTDGPIVVSAVVDPDFRSTGVITAAFEALGPGRRFAAHTGVDVLACAFGSHPAALRAAGRAGATIVAERDVLVPSSTSPLHSATGSGRIHSVRRDLEHSSDTHSVWQHLEPTSAPTVYAVAGDSGTTVGHFAVDNRDEATRLTIRATRPGVASPAVTINALVDAAAALLHDRDPAQIEVTVDTGDRPLLEALRSAGFHHDRTDVAFAMRAASDPQPGPDESRHRHRTTAPALLDTPRHRRNAP